MKTRPAARLRLTEPGLLRVAGVYDALSAILASDAGFHGLWVSSLGVSIGCYGLPDLALITMTDMIETGRRIRVATELPIIIDADTGYGGPLNVMRLVREAAAVGLDAICIEDAAFPKRNSFLDARYRRLASVQTMCARIRMAVDARPATSPLVIARTETLTQGHPPSQALSRAHAYADAGADAIVVHSVRPDAADLLQFAERWRRQTPLLAIPTSYPSVPLSALEDAGISAVILANQMLRAAHRTMRAVAAALVTAPSPLVVEDQISSVADLNQAAKSLEYLRLEEAITRGDGERVTP